MTPPQIRWRDYPSVARKTQAEPHCKLAPRLCIDPRGAAA